MRIVSLIRTGFVLSDPATERQRSTCPSHSFAELLRSCALGRPIRIRTGRIEKRSLYKIFTENLAEELYSPASAAARVGPPSSSVASPGGRSLRPVSLLHEPSALAPLKKIVSSE